MLAKPRLDYHSLQPGGAATAAIRAAAAKLPFVQSGAAHVRITGPVALADTQFATVAEGTVTGLIGSVALIALWLALAVGSWRLILPILATLGLGLMLTLLFAATAIGTLNLVSVGFAVLFVGIAVDFSLQFTVRFREAKHDTRDGAEALRLTARRAGSAILVAALATAAGFLAFVPTAFSGVAELGLIAGAGMLIAFLLHDDVPARGDHSVPPTRRECRSWFLLGTQRRYAARALALADPGGVCGIGCAGTRTSPTPLVRF